MNIQISIMGSNRDAVIEHFEQICDELRSSNYKDVAHAGGGNRGDGGSYNVEVDVSSGKQFEPPLTAKELRDVRHFLYGGTVSVKA